MSRRLSHWTPTARYRPARTAAGSFSTSASVPGNASELWVFQNNTVCFAIAGGSAFASAINAARHLPVYVVSRERPWLGSVDAASAAIGEQIEVLESPGDETRPSDASPCEELEDRSNLRSDLRAKRQLRPSRIKMIVDTPLVHAAS